ncbi:MAG: oligosaccharide flippase family protein [Bacteroidales bacterium]|nr:oligosaccharide flippase family protein [Bacteroidales bacterium]
MGVIARQSIRGALANYLGVAIGFFTTFFVLTDCLTQEEIGLTRVMVDAAMLFSGLAQLGTNASIIRFFPFFKSDDGKNHGIFGWSILIPFIGFSIFAILFFVFKQDIIEVYSQKSPLIADYAYLLLPLTFFALYLTVFETNASVLLRITVPRLVREVGIRVFNLVCYLLYGNGVITLDLFVLLFCLSYAVAMLINFFYLMSLGKISFRIDWQFINRERMKEMVLYTLFMTATVLAGNIPLINSLFLGAHTGLALTGVYTIAFYIANIVEVPYRSLGAISRPMIATAVRDDNWREVNRLGQQVSLHQFLVSSMVFFLIWTNLRALFAVIPHGDEYIGGMGVVFFLGLAKIVNSSLSVGTDILNYSRKYPFALIFIALLTTSAILLNNWLIPVWGINGSACATLFSYAIYFVCILWFINCQLKVSLFNVKHLHILILMLLLFALGMAWDALMLPLLAPLCMPLIVVVLINALLKTVTLTVVCALVVRRMHISKDVDAALEKIFNHKFN